LGGGLGPRVRQELSMNLAYFDAGFFTGAAARAADLPAGFFGFCLILVLVLVVTGILPFEFEAPRR